MPSTKSTKTKSTKTKSTQTKAQTKETFRIKGEELIKKVKDLIKEGNVRRIIIADKNEKTIMVLPLTLGVVGALVAPVLAAVGAVAALVTECSITVERD